MSTLDQFGLTVSHTKAHVLHVVTADCYDDWHAGLGAVQQNWLAAHNFLARPGAAISLPDAAGNIDMAIGFVAAPYIWNGAKLATALPKSVWKPAVYAHCIDSEELAALALGWGLSAYQFDRYRDKAKPPVNQLVCPETVAISQLSGLLAGT